MVAEEIRMFNDGDGQEFDGHYADDISLVLTRSP